MSLRTSIQRQRMSAKKGGILPSGYTECVYLESTGTQYIELGIAPMENFQFAVTFMCMNSAYSFLFGKQSSGDTTGIFFVGRDYEVGLQYGNYTYNRPQINANDVNTIEVKDRVVYTNGVEGEHLTQPFVATARYTAVLFAQRQYNNVITRYCQAMVYAFSCGNGADEINFIPALDPNGRPCMYDTISKQPFYNLGTGEFLYKVK